jgi:FkbM family methyltransferase
MPAILLSAEPGRSPGLRRAGVPVLEKPPPPAVLQRFVARTLAEGCPGDAPEPSLFERGLGLARRIAARIKRRLLRLAGSWFDRHVGEYRHRGLSFEIPREISTPEFRGRLLLGGYEAAERRLTARYVRRDATVLELGGGLGVISCLVNRRLADPRRHVVFEAHPALVSRLEANRARNGCRFMVRQEIVSRAPAAVFYCRDPFIAGGSTVRLGRRRIGVPTTTVERLEAETGLAFDSLVIDIEGGEHAFFAENSDLVGRLRVVVAELHPHLIGTAACAEIRERLKAGGLALRARRGRVEAWLRQTD